MGLLYAFPVDESEKEHVIRDDQRITIKSYGLPYIFWGYLAVGWIIALSMYFAIRQPIEKIIATQDILNMIIGRTTLYSLIFAPILFTSFYFYEKRISRIKNHLLIEHRLFYIPVLRKKIAMAAENPFFTRHHLESPNMARINKNPHYKGFQNKGHFELFVKDESGSEYKLDRHNRRADLKKISELIQS